MQPPALRAILTINVVIYLLWLIVFSHIEAVHLFVYQHIALNPGLPRILFEPWQLVTYNFLHLGTDMWGLIHILFNMLWLVWIGREYEELHGAHRLMAAYLIAGIGGGLLTVFLHALFPGVASFGGPVHGASASVVGVMMTVAILYPYKSIALIFIGTVRLLYIVLAFLAIDLLFASGTSVSAHLGGALFGFGFAYAERQGIDLSSWATVFFRRKSQGRSTSKSGGGGILNQLESWLSSRDDKKQGNKPSKKSPLRKVELPAEEDDNVSPNEVDRILDKISAQGYDALTPEEKRILYEASQQ